MGDNFGQKVTKIVHYSPCTILKEHCCWFTKTTVGSYCDKNRSSQVGY